MSNRRPVAANSARAPKIEGGESRTERLVSAAALQISVRGLGAVSARSIAQDADVAASAINYHFGNLERLLSLAFAQGEERTADWLDDRRSEIAALPRSPGGAVRALEHVIVAWTQNARPLALLYQERQAVAPAQGVGPWTALWRDFWLETAEGFGLGEVEGRLMHLFFESEALYHLSTWSPALEAAALRELVDHFGAVWLGAAAAPPIGALRHAQVSAGAQAHSLQTPAAVRIAMAAAAVAEGGLGRLTHRAVAAHAGVTTGAVTHHFRTIEELTAGAIRGQVLATAPDVEAAAAGAGLRSPEAFLATTLAYAMEGEVAGPALARRHLFLAAVRRPEQAGCAAVIRFAYGGTSREALQGLGLPDEVLALRAALLSRLLAATWYATSADAAPQETLERVFAAIGARCFSADG